VELIFLKNGFTMKKKLEDYKWICPEPFTNINVHVSGKMKPCCTMDYDPEMDKYPEVEVLNIQESSFSEYYHHPAVERLRNAMRNDNDDDYVRALCGKCKRVEEAGNRSQREYYVGRFDNEFKHLKGRLETIIETGQEPDFYHSFELKSEITNKCNLACNMCNSESSSRYFSEAIRLGEEEKNGGVVLKPKMSEAARAELPEVLSKVYELKVVGGEPLMSRGAYDLIAAVPNPEDKRLKVITNGTIDPTEFIELAKNFKEVDVNISIEGTPEVTEYIRYPSKWEDVIKHYHMLKHVARTRFVSTVNALNIGSSPELHKLMADNYFLHSQTNPVVNNQYALSSIPPDIRNMYLNKLYKHKMTTMIKYLEYATYNEADMYALIQHVKRRDKLRGTYLPDVCPEWKPYYDKVIM
jgi:MoaA/NifB/PqqE/SkfB family radical SAM enzyme